MGSQRVRRDLAATNATYNPGSSSVLVATVSFPSLTGLWVGWGLDELGSVRAPRLHMVQSELQASTAVATGKRQGGRQRLQDIQPFAGVILLTVHRVKSWSHSWTQGWRDNLSSSQSHGERVDECTTPGDEDGGLIIQSTTNLAFLYP